MTDEAVIFKKKSGKSRADNARKRTLADAEDSSTGVSEVVTKQKKAGGNPLRQGTLGAGKRRRTENGAAESSDEDEDKGQAEKVGVAYGAAGSTRALANARRSQSKSPPPVVAGQDLPPDAPGAGDEGLYKGAAAQKHQLPKGGARFGPVRGPANVRTITLTDYQPDICKDYKETGFCGFGDTCKFLHDRSDYLHGWQMDSAYAQSRAGGKTVTDEQEEEEEEVPFACLICRQPFTDPIVTRCGHYFCSTCAVKRFSKTPKCFACGAATGGIFNKAQKILDKMRKKQEAAAAAKAAKQADDEALDGIEGLQDLGGDAPQVEEQPMYGDPVEEGSERSFYEDE